MDQMAFFPPGYELKLEIPEVLKKVVVKRCRDNLADFAEMALGHTKPLYPYQRRFLESLQSWPNPASTSASTPGTTATSGARFVTSPSNS